jgi:ComF family protein
MGLLDLFLPPACAGCGRPGALLCARCTETLRPPGDPADRFLSSDPGVVIGEALAIAIAAFAFEGAIRRALAALKYTGVSRLAPILADAAAPRLRQLTGAFGPAVLVPVPVHRDRLRERGYNQAGLLAESLGRVTRLPVVNALERSRPTTKQHRLNRVARLHNLRGAFVAVEQAPATVVLVDDILTTSATLEACASVLRDAGSHDVAGFAVAREV